MLCQVCTEIFEYQVELGSVRNHSTALKIQQARDAGCQLCRLLWTFISNAQTIESQEDISVLYVVQRGKDSTVFGYKNIPTELFLLIFSLNVEITTPMDDRDKVKMFIVEPFKDLLRYTSHHTVPSYTASQTCLTLAQDWLTQCLRHHTRCQVRRQREAYYPTRLVKILQSGENKELRLCITEKKRPEGPYLTLSHRWGNASFLKLELSTLPDLEKGFMLADLPRTFQDAVAVTKRLGCDYIWIDSLCIIQNSNEDWIQEATLMGDVYANSFCNIAATWNSSSDNGCFTERNASDAEGLVVSPKWNGLENTTFRVVEFGLWDSLINSAPLNKRAWVVQERLLAPRVLHFSHTQLAWECHQAQACETYPAGLSTAQETAQTLHKGLDPDTDGKKLQSMGDSQKSPPLHAYHVWNKIVAAYTAGELTVASDKLVAISGLAKNMQALVQDDYLAGLWRRTLSSGLLWRVVDSELANGPPSTRPTQYRAPSWSWASLDGSVTPGRPNIERVLISIEEARTNPLVAQSPLGKVGSGWIRLRGLLLLATIAHPGSSVLPSRKLGVHFPTRNITEGQWIFPDLQDEILDQSIYCLVVLTNNRYGGTEVQGLALLCIDHAKSTYRRVGLFEGFHKAPDQNFPLQYSRSTRRMEFSEDAEVKPIVLV